MVKLIFGNFRFFFAGIITKEEGGQGDRRGCGKRKLGLTRRRGDAEGGAESGNLTAESGKICCPRMARMGANKSMEGRCLFSFFIRGDSRHSRACAFRAIFDVLPRHRPMSRLSAPKLLARICRPGESGASCPQTGNRKAESGKRRDFLPANGANGRE